MCPALFDSLAIESNLRITQQKLCMDGRTVWNLAFVVAAGTVLVLSASEVPGMPRLWIVGYAMQCVLHMVFVCVEYRRQRRQQPAVASSVQDRIGSSSGNLSVSSREGSASASASAQYVSLGQLDDESTRKCLMRPTAYTLFSEALSVLQQVTGPMHREVANCCRSTWHGIKILKGGRCLQCCQVIYATSTKLDPKLLE
ncbi:hypothetical protein AAZV13_09G071100 [Glycine max]|uniref:E3 ubiquitin-protein ligase At1g12760-like isoform X1 n=1 Tax=Glycine max TaxID=3847 RepID=UPI001B354ABF|nr:E3 ubiquitin-protein ligase At1g12760-like isoform X1 [Glycine max]